MPDLRRPRPRGDLHVAEVEPIVAQATSGDTHLHQFHRGGVAIAVGLEIFGDEPLADLGKILALERHGEFGGLPLMAQIRFPEKRRTRSLVAVGRELCGNLLVQLPLDCPRDRRRSSGRAAG